MDNDFTLSVCVLASGSKGNAILVFAEAEAILVDAGLSCRRIVEAVKAIGEDPDKRDYLVSKGIASERLEPVGHGESKPIASNKTDEGKAENRRVEIIFRQVLVDDYAAARSQQAGDGGCFWRAVRRAASPREL